MKNLCFVLTLVILFASSCQKESAAPIPIEDVYEDIDFRAPGTSGANETGVISEEVSNAKDLLVSMESFRQYAIFLGQFVNYTVEYIETNDDTFREEYLLLKNNLEADLNRKGIINIDDINFEAVRLAGEEVIGSAIEIETLSDECCRDAAQRRLVCRDLALRNFADFAAAIGVVAIIGAAIIIATEGAGTAAAELVISKLIIYAGGAAIWDYASLFANLEACNYIYEAEIQSCPCQCDWSNYPC